MESCHYCPSPGTTRDHVVPKSRGGVNAAWNIVRACPSCNVRKGSKWPTCACAKCRDSVVRHQQLKAKPIEMAREPFRPKFRLG